MVVVHSGMWKCVVKETCRVSFVFFRPERRFGENSSEESERSSEEEEEENLGNFCKEQ